MWFRHPCFSPCPSCSQRHRISESGTADIHAQSTGRDDINTSAQCLSNLSFQSGKRQQAEPLGQVHKQVDVGILVRDNGTQNPG